MNEISAVIRGSREFSPFFQFAKRQPSTNRKQTLTDPESASVLNSDPQPRDYKEYMFVILATQFMVFFNGIFVIAACVVKIGNNEEFLKNNMTRFIFSENTLEVTCSTDLREANL